MRDRDFPVVSGDGQTPSPQLPPKVHRVTSRDPRSNQPVQGRGETRQGVQTLPSPSSLIMVSR
jgi:hypothetical protein